MSHNDNNSTYLVTSQPYLVHLRVKAKRTEMMTQVQKREGFLLLQYWNVVKCRSLTIMQFLFHSCSPLLISMSLCCPFLPRILVAGNKKWCGCGQEVVSILVQYISYSCIKTKQCLCDHFFLKRSLMILLVPAMKSLTVSVYAGKGLLLSNIWNIRKLLK